MKNACIIGYGAIGPIHAMALEHTENARFYAVCDIDPARLDACREQYDVKCLDHFDAVLADEQIDSVHICTPHYLHFDMIRRALAAGKTVVAEKPATMTKSEWDQLKALPGADKICLVLQNRYNPSIVRLKEMAQSGELCVCRMARKMGNRGRRRFNQPGSAYIGFYDLYCRWRGFASGKQYELFLAGCH